MAKSKKTVVKSGGSKRSRGKVDHRPNEKKQLIEGSRRLNAFAMDAQRIVLIGLDTEHSSCAEHAGFDNRVLTIPVKEEWVLDMVAHGWAGGAVTVSVEKDARGRQIVVAIDGKQRIRTAREANKRLKAAGRPLIEVPALVMKGEDAEKLGSMIALNEHRIDDTILEKARKAQAFLSFNKSLKEAALRFGVTVPTISSWLQLLGSDPRVLKEVESNKIPASVAIKIAQLPRGDQQAAVKKLKEEDKLTVSGAEEIVFSSRVSADRQAAAASRSADGDDKDSGDDKKVGDKKSNGKHRAQADSDDDEKNSEGYGRKMPIVAIRRVIKAYEAGSLRGTAKNLSEETYRVLRVVAGQIEPRLVAGMQAALAQVGYGPRSEAEDEAQPPDDGVDLGDVEDESQAESN